MIDLHLHLDGSLDAKTVLYLAKMQKVWLPAYTEEALLPYLVAPKECADLNEYLTCFSLPLSILQNEDALFFAAKSLVARLANQNIIYAEIRFAPQLHTNGTMTMRDAVLAVIGGVKAALIEHSGIKVNLILCCMRMSDNRAENMETVALAAEFLGLGVVAVDLAGAEAIYKTSNFKEVFAFAHSKNIPITIHAGEADGPDSIRAAIDMGAARIGHGIHVVEDKALLSIIIEKQIALEMCPTSNIQTRAVEDIYHHPIIKLLEIGALVTLNTDNMTVSNTTIEKEFLLLFQKLNLNQLQQKKLLQNSAKSAFLSQSEKENLYRKIS